MERLLAFVKLLASGYQRGTRITPNHQRPERRTTCGEKSKRRRKSVKFSKKDRTLIIPTWKCWSLRDTDLKIEFTYGHSQERVFIGHCTYVEIHCVLPPPSPGESLHELENKMQWECTNIQNAMAVGTPSQNDVRILLSIFLLAYWSKIELEECAIVKQIHKEGVNLGSKDFEYPEEVNRQKVNKLLKNKQNAFLLDICLL